MKLFKGGKFMSVSLSDFLIQITSDPALFITVLLILIVILVNGWTNAPNVIATCVSTKSLSPKIAIIMAAVFNFLGVLVMTMVNKAVAETIYNMVDLRGGSLDALIALCAALFTVAIWVTAALYFSIQTSESYALIAGISGAAIALQGGLRGIN
jgi:PiT family inorganic phosphate transporter